jgi:anti-sigma B factor antagonist
MRMNTGRHRMPPSPLQLTLSMTGDTAATLTIDGRLDAETADEFTTALHTVLTEPGLTQLMLELGSLTLIDSAGVSALTAAYQLAQRQGVALTAVDCSLVVQQALEVTGLYKHLTSSGR